MSSLWARLDAYHVDLAVAAAAAGFGAALVGVHSTERVRRRRLALPVWLGALVAVARLAVGVVDGAFFGWLAVIVGAGVAAMDDGPGSWGTGATFGAETRHDTPTRVDRAAADTTPLVCATLMLAGWWWVLPDTEVVVGLGSALAAALAVNVARSGRRVTADAGVVMAGSLVAASPFVVISSAGNIPAAVAAGGLNVAVLPALTAAGRRRRRPWIGPLVQVLAIVAARHVRFRSIGWGEAALVLGGVVVANVAAFGAALVRRRVGRRDYPGERPLAGRSAAGTPTTRE